MPLEATLHELNERVERLKDNFRGLLQFYDDRPKPADPTVETTTTRPARLQEQADPYPVQHLGDVLIEIHDLASQIGESAQRSIHLIESGCDLAQARREMADCHRGIARIERQVLTDVLDYDRLRAVKRSVRKLRPSRSDWKEWMGWIRELTDCLGSCRGPLCELNLAVVSCWQELAERSASHYVSVRSTQVGRVKRVVHSERGRHIATDQGS
jgi:hypothetical protein